MRSGGRRGRRGQHGERRRGGRELMSEPARTSQHPISTIELLSCCTHNVEMAAEGSVVERAAKPPLHPDPQPIRGQYPGSLWADVPKQMSGVVCNVLGIGSAWRVGCRLRTIL